MPDQIKPDLRRRSAVEPINVHLMDEYRMGRSHVTHAQGDAINAVLAEIGYTYRRLLAGIAVLCAFICAALAPHDASNPTLNSI